MGDKVNGCVGVLVLQVFMTRILRKVSFLVSRDRDKQVLVSLISCYKTVILGRSWREGDAALPRPTKGEQQALPSWQGRAYSPEKVKVCARRGCLWPFSSLVPENGRWLLDFALTFNVRGNPDLTEPAVQRVRVSLPSLHHYSQDGLRP